jgi:hypothetical protein
MPANKAKILSIRLKIDISRSKIKDGIGFSSLALAFSRRKALLKAYSHH